MNGSRRAVFLDRDGVLNRALVRDGKPYPPASPAEVEILPGVAEALAGLRRSGFLLVVVTNQPDVGRRAQDRAVVEAIHDRLRESLPLDDIFVCYHTDDDGCECRKPLPGLLLQAAAKHKVELAASYVVGDRWRDVEAGENAGCRTIWIDRGYREQAPRAGPSARADSLRSAADWILQQEAMEAAL